MPFLADPPFIRNLLCDQSISCDHSSYKFLTFSIHQEPYIKHPGEWIYPYPDKCLSTVAPLIFSIYFLIFIFSLSFLISIVYFAEFLSLP